MTEMSWACGPCLEKPFSCEQEWEAIVSAPDIDPGVLEFKWLGSDQLLWWAGAVMVKMWFLLCMCGGGKWGCSSSPEGTRRQRRTYDAYPA